MFTASVFLGVNVYFACDSSSDSDDEAATSTSSVDASASCTTIQASVSNAGFSDDVTVTCDDNYAYLTSDTYPDHDLMNGITGTNEQIPVPAVDYGAPIKLSRSGTTNLNTMDSALGVAVNGVPIYDYSAAGDLDLDVYDETLDTYVLGQLDDCGGHAGRGDDYHYHASPSCMIANMENAGDDAILGWGYDGYPLYGNNNPDGSEIADGTLDTCNGQIDETFGFRYHTSVAAPYVFKCLRGTIDEDVLPRVAPMQGRTDGTPPQGGVTDLSHTVVNGTNRLEYTYSGEQYYLEYSASDTAGCYNFTTKTVTDGGVVKEGEYCRE